MLCTGVTKSGVANFFYACFKNCEQVRRSKNVHFCKVMAHCFAHHVLLVVDACLVLLCDIHY